MTHLYGKRSVSGYLCPELKDDFRQKCTAMKTSQAAVISELVMIWCDEMWSDWIPRPSNNQYQHFIGERE